MFSGRNSWQDNIGPAMITSKTILIFLYAFFFSAVCEPAAPDRRSTGCQAILHHPGREVRKLSRNASKHVFSAITKEEEFRSVKDLLLLSIKKITCMCREFSKMYVKKVSTYVLHNFILQKNSPKKIQIFFLV
jgi:hypothetical protein